MHSYTNQLIKLRNHRIKLPNTHFLFDVFNEKFEYIGATLKRHD